VTFLLVISYLEAYYYMCDMSEIENHYKALVLSPDPKDKLFIKL